MNNENRYEPVEDLGLGNEMISLLHRWQNEEKMDDSFREEAMEYYIDASENQKKNVRISRNSMKKKSLNKKMIGAAMVVGLVIGSTATMLHIGENIIMAEMVPKISSEIYVTFTNNRPTDVHTREYVDDMVVIDKLIDMGYSIDQAAIVGDCYYCIEPSKVEGSTMLGRLQAKISAVTNGKVIVNDEVKGAMKL